MAKPQTFDDPAIRDRLAADLPRWNLVDGAIERSFATTSWKGALMLATTIGHLAEVAWHHPDLLVSYGGVKVRLATHRPKGITDLDFALAARIEAMVAWRPQPPFTGTPETPEHAYLKPEP